MMKYLFITISVLLLLSCKKEEARSKTTLLTQKIWFITNKEIKTGSTGAWINDYTAVPACARDDFYAFLTNNTVLGDQGSNKCNPTGPQATTDNWFFMENETKLKIGGSSVTIEILTETALVTVLEDNSVNPSKFIRLTYSH